MLTYICSFLSAITCFKNSPGHTMKECHWTAAQMCVTLLDYCESQLNKSSVLCCEW